MKSDIFFSRTLFAVLLSLLSVLSVTAYAETFKEGVDYTVLEAPQRTDDPAKIEVREIFWFGCPHCYSLELALDPWRKKLPADVNYTATPAIFSSSWEPHARAYFIAKSLGKSDEINAALFKAIHADKESIRKKRELAVFFGKHGVSEEQFDRLYESFAVRVGVRKSEALVRALRLSGVPAIMVNGKYLIEIGKAKTNGRMLEIADFLIEKERKK